MTTTRRFPLILLLLAGLLLLLVGCGSPSDPVVPPEQNDNEIYDRVSQASTRGFPRDIDINGNTLYVAEGSAGIGAYDISDPANIALIKRENRGEDIRLVKAVPEVNMLFVNLTNRTEVFFLESLEWTQGSQLGSFQCNALIAKVVYDTATSQNLLTPVEYMENMTRLIVADESGGDGLQVYTVFKDSSDIIPGAEYSLFDHEANAVFEFVQDESGLTWIADTDTVATGLLDYGVGFVDLSKPTWESDGLYLSEVDTPGEATNLVYSDNHVYVADGVAGLTVIDVTTIATPIVVANWKIDGLDHVTNVVAKDDLLAVIDQFDGVYFLDISDPATPLYLGAFEVREPVDAVFLDDDRVLIASAGEGLTVIRLALNAN